MSPAAFAAAHAALGEREQARAWLERAFEERASTVPLLGVLPVRKLFSGEPRFAEFLRSIGLEPSDR